jgi:hypothetical protein
MNKAIEAYNKYPAIKAAIDLIPYTGGALNSLIDGYGNKTRQIRLNQMLTIFDNLVKDSGISEQELEDKITNEEFYDLFLHAAESCIKTRHEIKIKAYSNLLFNQINQSDTSTISSELMVTTLDNLTIDEIYYLSELQTKSGTLSLATVFGEIVELESCKKILQEQQIELSSRNDLPVSCVYNFTQRIVWKFLQDKNIIDIKKNDAGSFRYSFSNSNSLITTNLNYTDNMFYIITDFGYEFLRWIQTNDI